MGQAQVGSPGTFKDLERLFEQLARRGETDFDTLFDELSRPALVELAKPLPRDKYLPRKRVGRNAAAHNRALLDQER